MTATPKQLVAPADLANAATLLYTSPAAGKGTWIDKATVHNHGGATHNVTFGIGGSAGINTVVDAKTLADKATDLLPELVGQFLPAGGTLYGNADAATAVNVVISGRELT
jgi:phage gpG-like protein